MAEATAQLKNALTQIAALPSTAELRHQQIRLQVALANTLMHAKGYAAAETKASFEQARLYIERAEARHSENLLKTSGSYFRSCMGSGLLVTSHLTAKSCVTSRDSF